MSDECFVILLHRVGCPVAAKCMCVALCVLGNVRSQTSNVESGSAVAVLGFLVSPMLHAFFNFSYGEGGGWAF